MTFVLYVPFGRYPIFKYYEVVPHASLVLLCSEWEGAANSSWPYKSEWNRVCSAVNSHLSKIHTFVKYDSVGSPILLLVLFPKSQHVASTACWEMLHGSVFCCTPRQAVITFE